MLFGCIVEREESRMSTLNNTVTSNVSNFISTQQLRITTYPSRAPDHDLIVGYFSTYIIFFLSVYVCVFG